MKPHLIISSPFIAAAVAMSAIHGYGKQRRLRGTVTGFRQAKAPSEVPGAWVTCYGSAPATAACIEITLSTK